MTIDPLGDAAVTVTLGPGIDEATMAAVRELAAKLSAARRTGITDVVPAYASVTVFYEPGVMAGAGHDAFQEVRRFIHDCASRSSRAEHQRPPQLVEIPVCYASDFAPDLEVVAAQAKMSAGEVTARHAEAEYLVHAIGFTPGFPYLGGLPAALAVPRRATPRTHVPAGSVAIGGAQTGIYPVDSPGGWHIIGRTPLALFLPSREPAALLRPGDRVKFKPIWAGEFAAWK